MNLLKDGIAQQAVIKTVQTRKLTIDGLTNAYPVYKVRLDWLFYNDQNDRIATWISQYKAQHDGNVPDSSDREAYNAIIEQFIVESNPDAIRKTQANIEMVDQREAGVVLADGRIIDGNRRFTCLRRLAAKNDRFGYFETVILDRNIEHSAKQIKMLELSIQHGEESRVDYNPVDRLVGIYNDIVATQLLSVEEYARSSNEPEIDVKRRVEIAKLMVEFLEYINAPGQFYIARDLQLYSPLEELLILKLFLSFVQVGLFSVGGGYAAIPLIQNQIVNVWEMMTLEEFADLITIAEISKSEGLIPGSTTKHPNL